MGFIFKPKFLTQMVRPVYRVVHLWNPKDQQKSVGEP